MAEFDVDVAILGAGTAGLNALREVEQQGKTGLIIEGGPFGTTCARVGCMPSKLLIAAAEIAHNAERGGPFGVHVDVRVMGKEVMERVQKERDRFVGFVVESSEEKLAAGKIIRGYATFREPGVLDVDNGDVVRASSFVLAVGTRPVVPGPLRHLPDDVMLDNESVFELNDLPESVFVVGAGVIGMELGQALHRLGVRTTIVGRDGQLTMLSDPRVLKVAIDVMKDELDLHVNSDIREMKATGDGVEVTFRGDDGSLRTASYEKVLVAAGRVSNLDRLNLSVYGVELGRGNSIDVDEHTMQHGELPLFVPGDSNSQRPLLHEASDEGRIAGANAATFPETLAFKRRTPLGIVFTSPQIAVVGNHFKAHKCSRHAAGEVSYANQGRARVNGENAGLVRIYGDVASGKITGAEMFGPAVEHTAHLLAWSVQAGLTVDELNDMPFYHPVVEEGIRTALRDLREALRTPKRIDLCDEFAAGS